MSKSEFLTKTKLKNRGWSDRLITEFYDNPDKEGQAYGRTYYLYSIQKIKRIEQTERFQIEYKKVENRRKAMKKSVKKRKKQLISDTKEKGIVIKKMPYKQVRNLAISNYNEKNSFNEKFALKNSDEEFLHRIMVNYIRHNLTKYDFILDSLTGKIGKHQAYSVIKKKILEKIGRAYGSLSSEAFRQRSMISDPQ